MVLYVDEASFLEAGEDLGCCCCLSGWGAVEEFGEVDELRAVSLWCINSKCSAYGNEEVIFLHGGVCDRVGSHVVSFW